MPCGTRDSGRRFVSDRTLIITDTPGYVSVEPNAQFRIGAAEPGGCRQRLPRRRRPAGRTPLRPRPNTSSWLRPRHATIANRRPPVSRLRVHSQAGRPAPGPPGSRQETGTMGGRRLGGPQPSHRSCSRTGTRRSSRDVQHLPPRAPALMPTCGPLKGASTAALTIHQIRRRAGPLFSMVRAREARSPSSIVSVRARTWPSPGPSRQ